ncbi:GDYXXLXY domain-containing protein [Maricaulis sp.]|uniref:GDYXXLXY domain-containing protein n=1 Tax=Maricaulis sp. TaxID=1486257 RepID=UPI0026369B55|nr:GDYXXLXY domain-containing protein [Maricaulis sp.]
MTRTLRLGLIAAAMTAFLGVMLASHLDRRANGAEILLPVEGYDPRDILLGHYANIRTPLNRLATAALDGDDDFTAGDRIFVVLETGAGSLARPVSIHREPPGSGLVALGRVLHVGPAHGEWVEETDPETGEIRRTHRAGEGEWIQARFNTERYYASREQALALETRLRERRDDGTTGVSLIVSVPADGGLIVKGFEMDGERRIDRIW